MIEGGEDPRFLARRMVILASEDIGLADPQALLIAEAAARAVEYVGLPEAALNLAEAVIYLARAPKSNSVIVALGRAQEDVRSGAPQEVPDASSRQPLQGGGVAWATGRGTSIRTLTHRAWSRSSIVRRRWKGMCTTSPRHTARREGRRTGQKGSSALAHAIRVLWLGPGAVLALALCAGALAPWSSGGEPAAAAAPEPQSTRVALRGELPDVPSDVSRLGAVARLPGPASRRGPWPGRTRPGWPKTCARSPRRARPCTTTT